MAEHILVVARLVYWGTMYSSASMFVRISKRTTFLHVYGEIWNGVQSRTGTYDRRPPVKKMDHYLHILYIQCGAGIDSFQCVAPTDMHLQY